MKYEQINRNLDSICGNHVARHHDDSLQRRLKKGQKNQIKYEIRKVEAETRVYNIYIPASLHGLSEVEVFPQVSGIIRQVNFKDGFKVKKGQPLFVIDQTEHKLNVQNAQANLAAAKAQMETTKLQYESNQKLAAKKIISDYVLSSSMNAYHVAQASVQQAQAQLAMAQTTLGYCTVRSRGLPPNAHLQEDRAEGCLLDFHHQLLARSLQWYARADEQRHEHLRRGT